MKTVYDGLYGRIEISNGLLARVESAATDVETGLKAGQHKSIEFYIEPQKPRFFGGELGKPVIRIAAGGAPYSNDGPVEVKADLGNYITENVNAFTWFSMIDRGDVRQIPDVYFDGQFARGIYYGQYGLKYLRLVRKVHLGLLANVILAHATADAKRGRSDTEETAYYKRVYRAAETTGRRGGMKPLITAIRTNPLRKIWRRRSGGCCG